MSSSVQLEYITSGGTPTPLVNTSGQVVVKNTIESSKDWTYTGPGISNTTTPVTVKTSGGTGVVNYITGLQIAADTLGAATELVIRSANGGTVIWRTKLQTAGLPLTTINFNTPLRSASNALLEVATLTATVTGIVYVSLQGYTS